MDEESDEGFVDQCGDGCLGDWCSVVEGAAVAADVEYEFGSASMAAWSAPPMRPFVRIVVVRVPSAWLRIRTERSRWCRASMTSPGSLVIVHAAMASGRLAAGVCWAKASRSASFSAASVPVALNGSG